MYARLGPRGSKTTMSAVAARGTVEMLSAPEWVKVSTDGPSQPLSPRPTTRTSVWHSSVDRKA